MELGKSQPEAFDFAGTLRKSWHYLKTSVATPLIVRSWDVIVLTAASAEQAELFEWQLKRARRLGRIANYTLTLVVPDPGGHRIGSGGSTLNAINALVRHLESMTPLVIDRKTATPASDSEVSIPPVVSFLTKRHILLLNAGGEGKTVPWAGPMGKVFMPLPYFAEEDPDRGVPLLFDHILAVLSRSRESFKNEGGIFIVSDDVLLCFDASTMILPDDTSCMIAAPVTPDIASNHRVIVSSTNGILSPTCSVTVENLLQEPTMEEMVKNQAILDDGRALVDTGIMAIRGKAWADLIMLACSSQPMIEELMRSQKEMSLYEDLIAAWIPAKHEWLQLRPMGKELTDSLGKQKLFTWCTHDSRYLHFRTSGELLNHLFGTVSEVVGRRHLCSIPENSASDIAASAIVISSRVAAGVTIGDDSIVYNSSISGDIQIGSQSIIINIKFPGGNDGIANNAFRYKLPDRHCLWEVPLVGGTDRVIVYCGLHDNPKDSLLTGGTFCGKSWEKVLHDLGIEESDLWSSRDDQEKCLWNAEIYPILSFSEMLSLAAWLMGMNDPKNTSFLSSWKSSCRVSLMELHRSMDFPQMFRGSINHQAELAAEIAKGCIDNGVGRNLSLLFDEILQNDISGIKMCKDLLSTFSILQVENSKFLPKIMACQVKADLLQACGDEALACELKHQVWAAVTEETASALDDEIASAVRCWIREHPDESNNFEGDDEDKLSAEDDDLNDYEFAMHEPSAQEDESSDLDNNVESLTLRLPFCIDFVGGWSDTPPWSLEHAGCALNMSIRLSGYVLIKSIIEKVDEVGVSICHYSEDSTDERINYSAPIAPPFNCCDAIRISSYALLVTGVNRDEFLKSEGLSIETWFLLPDNLSSFRPHSILAAIVAKGLLTITHRDDSDENVARCVLLIEQLMGTGIGWREAIGVLYPGIKFAESSPSRPLQFHFTPLTCPQLVLELKERMLVVSVGKVPPEREGLRKVLTRYLQRDRLFISITKRLNELARIGKEALMNCDLDGLGKVMLESWRLHLETDPHFSSAPIDKLFKFAEPFCCGYRVLGPGGGGFAVLIGKNAKSTRKLGYLLRLNPPTSDLKVYRWTMF